MPTVNQSYELTFILDERANPDDAKKKITDIKSSIDKLGGQTTKEEAWGRRELAYPIKRNRSGFYVTLWFDLDPKSVKTLEQQLNFDESVIRSLVIKAYSTAQPGNLYPVTEEEKSDKATAQQKEEAASAEEMLRRSSKTTQVSKEEEVDLIPEEERLKKLDESLEELLKDEE